MDEDCTFSKELEGISIDANVIKHGKREARHKLITNFCMTPKVKQEHTQDLPAIYGMRPVLDSDTLET